MGDNHFPVRKLEQMKLLGQDHAVDMRWSGDINLVPTDPQGYPV